MSDASQGPGWWQASDGKWYSPEQSTSYDFDDGEGPVAAHRHPNGGGWVADSATVAESAFVGPTAAVFDFARVLDYATVTDTAWVHGVALVSGHARIGGDALVDGNAKVIDNADVSDDAYLTGYAVVEGHARVSGNAQVLGHGVVRGNARVLGDAVVPDDQVVDGDSVVMGADEVPFDESFPPDEEVGDEYEDEASDEYEDEASDEYEAEDGSDEYEEEVVGSDATKKRGRLRYPLFALVVVVVIGATVLGVLSGKSSPSTDPTSSALTATSALPITSTTVPPTTSTTTSPPSATQPTQGLINEANCDGAGSSSAVGQCYAVAACQDWSTSDGFIQQAATDDDAAIDFRLQDGSDNPADLNSKTEQNNSPYISMDNNANLASTNDGRWQSLSDMTNTIDNDIDNVAGNDQNALDQVAADSAALGSWCDSNVSGL